MKKCNACGKSFPDFIQFCTVCKINLDLDKSNEPSASNWVPAPPASTQNKNNKLLYVVLGGISLLVVFWLSRPPNNEPATVIKKESTSVGAKTKPTTNPSTNPKSLKSEEISKIIDKSAKAPLQDGLEQTSSNKKLLESATKCTKENCLGILLVAAQPSNDEAIEIAATRFAQFNDAQTGDRVTARELNARGLAEFRNGQYETAIGTFTSAALADRNDSEIMANLAYAMILAGRIDDADKILTGALLINPKRSATWGTAGELFAKKPGMFDWSVRCYQLAYKFSKNQNKTLQIFIERSLNSDNMELRPVLAEAVRRIQSN